MRDEIKEIAHTLRDHKPPARQIYIQITDVLEDSLPPGIFIKNLESEMSNADCLYCDEHSFCCFYITFAYYKEGQIQMSKDYLEEAIVGFRTKTMEWNEAMAHWLLGEILIDGKDSNLAQRSLERAIRILEPVINELKTKSKYEDAKKGEEYIGKIQSTLERARLKYSPNHQTPYLPPALPAQPKQPQLPATPERPQLPAPSAQPELLQLPAPVVNQNRAPQPAPNYIGYEGYIVLHSVPIFESVEAGHNGPVWAGRLEIGKTKFRRVVLQDQYYKIFSTKYGDRQITLSPGRYYAWTKVHGHSMNAAIPIPIEEGNYVLFYQAIPDKSGIVIVAKSDNSEGNIYMVKRYSHNEKLLISETTEKGEIYNPIPLTTDFRILGIVVAIAKPA